MDEEIRRRGEELFQAVYHLPRQERRAFLDTHCDDARVRAEVDDLLEHAARGDETLGRVFAPLVGEVKASDSRGTLDGQDVPERIRYFGDYELVEEIASGGMGIVYRARQVSLRRVVALKMIRAGQFASSGDLERFRVEVESAARLDHPNIVPIYEVGEHEGRQYFTMKLIEGQSLAERISGAPLAVRDAAALLETTARAVHHAHERGILHRDLKPGNVLLDARGEPYVSDFGLAKNVETETGLTRTGEILGTPGFMSPEQAAGSKRSITVAGDVYGLGAILYCALVGRAPFSEETPLETLKSVQERDPEPPGRLNESVDRDLETICLKALEKDPGNRYHTAAALADDLRRFLSGEPIEARPITSIGRTLRWCRRNPAMAGLLVAVALLLVAITVGTTVAAFGFRAMAREESRLKNEAVDKAEVAERARESLRGALYVHQIAEAKHLTAEGWYGPADDLLDQTSADLRGWEWWYLKRQRHGGSWTVADEERHRDAVSTIAFSPDGAHVASGSGDGTVKLWRAESGEHVRTFRGGGDVSSLAFSPDGELIAYGTTRPTVKLLNVRTGEKVAELPEERESYQAGECCIEGLAFSPDGARIAWGAHDGIVRIWSLAAGHEEMKLTHTDQVWDVAFSPDGRQLASACWDRTVRVWDLSSGGEVARLEHEHWVARVAWSPDGRRIAAGDFDMTVRLWDVPSGRLLQIFGQDGPVSEVTFSPDGRRIASAGLQGSNVHIWDPESGREVLKLPGMKSVAFSPDGHRLAAVGDRDRTRIALWDATPREGKRAPLLHTLAEHELGVMSVAFSLDGQYVATSGIDRTVRLWDVTTGRLEHTWRAILRGPSTVDFSPDGQLLAAGGQPYSVNVWDLEARDEKLPRKRINPPISIAFDAAGRLACGTFWGGVRLFDPRTGEGLEPKYGSDEIRHEGAVRAVACSADGAYVASGGTDGTVRIWDAGTGAPLHVLREHGAVVWGLDFSADSRHLASSGHDGQVRLWDPATGALVRELQSYHEESSGVAFSPDGEFVAAGCGDARRGRVVIWSVRTGQEELVISGHAAHVLDVAFSPDGRVLATASYDRTAKLWDVSALTR